MSHSVDKYVNEIAAVTLMSVTGLISIGLGLYNQFIAKNKNKCERMTGLDKQLCYVQLRIDANKQFIVQLRTSKKDCKKTRDPEKCLDKINEKIRKLNAELTKLSEELYNLRSKQRGVR